MPRDPEKLLKQYQPLINSVFGQYKGNFSRSIGVNSYMQGARGQTNQDIPDLAAQADLKSYIDEQFVRLVKEYDPNGGVDFPGYIYAKLSRRVLGSYIHGRNRDNERESVGLTDNEVENMLSKSIDYNHEQMLAQVIEDVMSSLDNTVDQYIFHLLTNQNKKLTNYAIYLKVHSVYPRIDREKFNVHLDYIKGKVKEEINANVGRLYGK